MFPYDIKYAQGNKVKKHTLNQNFFEQSSSVVWATCQFLSAQMLCLESVPPGQYCIVISSLDILSFYKIDQATAFMELFQRVQKTPPIPIYPLVLILFVELEVFLPIKIRGHSGWCNVTPRWPLPPQARPASIPLPPPGLSEPEPPKQLLL